MSYTVVARRTANVLRSLTSLPRDAVVVCRTYSRLRRRPTNLPRDAIVVGRVAGVDVIDGRLVAAVRRLLHIDKRAPTSFQVRCFTDM